MEREKLKEAIEKALEQSKVKIPQGPYDNTIQNFFFTDEEIVEANKEGKLLMLDLDVGKQCDLGCDFCYVNTHNPDSGDYVVKTTNRIKKIIDEGLELGLKVIKIVGAGEPFLFPEIFTILEYAHVRGVGSLVFTAGHVIGDDNLARKVFKKMGITSGKDLVQRLDNLGTSVVVKYLTFNDELQTRLVAPKGKAMPYARLRDIGFLRLVEQGFTSSVPTRLGIDSLILDSTYEEANDIFSLFNEYNIFVLMNTPVNCGGTAIESRPLALNFEHAVDAAKSVYRYCQKKGIKMNVKSPYFGGPPCSQLNHAMHIGDDSRVKACPGANAAIGKYEPGKLREIWEKNMTRTQYHLSTSHICPPRQGITMPIDFVEQIT